MGSVDGKSAIGDDGKKTSTLLSGRSQSASTTESFLHAILKSTILVGLGIICGYGLFYVIFHHRCGDVLDEIERGHQLAMTSLNDLYRKATDDHKQCMEDDTRTNEIYELRGRLEAQSDLVSSHRSLLEKHKVSTERLEEIAAELERKEAELFIVQKRIDLYNKEKSELQQELNDLKNSVAVELGEKTSAVETLKSSIEAFQLTEKEMLDHVQSRHSVMTRQL